MSDPKAPLAGIRVIESSLLGPAAITTHLADLGAEVIKVESPAGDYVREMTWPIINGVSLLHLHINRGKKSIALDLKTPDGVEVYRELVKGADVVVEAMRPGSLARLGLGYDDLRALNPKIVFINISGYGMTGPYENLPSHGIAFDTWAGLVNPAYDDEGYCYIAEHPIDGHARRTAVRCAREFLQACCAHERPAQGCMMEIGQSDAAAYMDWYRSESWKAYERPESEVTGNKSDNYERRAPGTAGMKEGVRYQMYDSADGHILFMASEQAFWKNFCEGVGRMDLFEKWPGSKFADHARGNRELQATLRDIFKTRSSEAWIEFGNTHNTPIAPVNTPKTIADDPQFKVRFPHFPASEHGAEMMSLPLKFLGEELPVPKMAPTVGQHTADVLGDLLGFDEDKIADLRRAGAFGKA